MKSEQLKIASVMKYVVFLMVIVFVALMLLYASGSSRPFSEVSEAVSASLDTENLTEQDDAAFKRNFGLNAADYDGVMYYSSEFSISAEEVLLVRVADSSQVQEVTSAIEKRIDSRRNDFEGYAPEEVKLLDDAVQSVRGNYIFFASAPKAGEYLSVFSSSL